MRRTALVLVAYLLPCTCGAPQPKISWAQTRDKLLLAVRWPAGCSGEAAELRGQLETSQSEKAAVEAALAKAQGEAQSAAESLAQAQTSIGAEASELRSQLETAQSEKAATEAALAKAQVQMPAAAGQLAGSRAGGEHCVCTWFRGALACRRHLDLSRGLPLRTPCCWRMPDSSAAARPRPHPSCA